MADEQPNDPPSEEAGLPPFATPAPSANPAPLPPLAQQYPPLYPPAGQAQPPTTALPPIANIAPTFNAAPLPQQQQPPPQPGGFPVFAPPVAAPYGAPYGPPPGYLDLPVRPHRPGVLTAIAIASIVMAVLGFFAAGVAAVGATAFLIRGDSAASLQVRKATDALTAPPDAPQVTVKASPGPRGMEETDRANVIGAISQLEGTDENRQKQLDLLLTLAGKVMFPKAGPTTSVQQLQEMVINHGEMFSTKVDAQGTTYFVTEGGRLDLYDDRAVFRPADGSPTVRVAANPPPPIGLTNEEAESVVSQVQITTKNALNTQQQASLRAMLLDPGQDLIPPSRLSAAIASTSVDQGMITIKFTGGHAISLDPQGAPRPPGSVPPPKVNRILFGSVVAVAAISVGLAIYLFVGAIQMLRGRFTAAGRIHNRYALIKIASTLALIVLAIWMRSDFITRFTEALESVGATSVTPDLPAWAPRLIALAALGLVYPLVLLVVLRLGSVRIYLEPKGQSRIF